MKIAVIGAMREEIEFLLPHMENLREERKLKTTFYVGSFSGKELVVVQSGVGKVASGILFSALMHAHPDTQLAINTGVAGGVPGKVEIGEVVVADRVAYADVDITAGGKYVYGELPGYPRFLPSGSELFRKVSLPHKIGTILTGDKFFSEPEDIEPLLEGPYRNENVLAFDMESAAFAQSALFYGVPFVSVRAISDIIGIKGQLQDFEDNLERAALNSNRMLLEALIHLEIGKTFYIF